MQPAQTYTQPILRRDTEYKIQPFPLLAIPVHEIQLSFLLVKHRDKQVTRPERRVIPPHDRVLCQHFQLDTFLCTTSLQYHGIGTYRVIHHYRESHCRHQRIYKTDLFLLRHKLVIPVRVVDRQYPVGRIFYIRHPEHSCAIRPCHVIRQFQHGG